MHQWRVAKYLLLSLPDVDGFAERYTQWQCATCPIYVEIDGHIRQNYPLMTPEFWQQLDPGSPTKRTRQARRWQRAQRR